MTHIGEGHLMEIYAFIRGELEATGCAPSISEICRAVGIGSTASVHRYLEILELRGMIVRQARRPRAIQIVEVDEDE